MNLWIQCFTLLILLATNVATGQEPQVADKPHSIMPQQHSKLFEKFCFDCHDTDSSEGEINLQTIDFDISNDIATAERWQKILNAINSGEMPPKDATQISDEEKTSFLEDLSKQLVGARVILSDSGGVTTIRRLNRREYRISMKALLGVEPEIANLPDDSGTGDFDTTGASLFFSSDQFEQYLAIARASLTAALTTVDEKPESVIVRVEAEIDMTEYTSKAAAAKRKTLSNAESFLAQSEKPPEAFGLVDKDQALKQVRNYKSQYPQLADFLARPEIQTGAVLSYFKSRTRKIEGPPINDMTGGKYILRVRAAAYDGAPEWRRYLEYGIRYNGSSTQTVLGQRKVTGSMDEPAIIEIPIDVRPRSKAKFFVRQRDYQSKSARFYTNQQAIAENGIGLLPFLWVDYIECEGPIHETWPPSATAELIPARNKKESSTEYAKRTLVNFAYKAFRGKPPAPEFIDRLVKRYNDKRESGLSSRLAFIDTFSIILASPGFLYMSEPTSGVGPTMLSDNELAVRLSYFLWSAPPDEELMQLARDGKLVSADVLKVQTERLLADPRNEEFISGFTHQWLNMKRLDMFQFEARYHPDFDEVVRESARQEIYQTILTIIEEKLSIGALLKSDFVVVNDVLANYYGLDGVPDDGKGHVFRKIAVPADSPRGGLLGTTAIHVMGSDGIRSSPVERGAWVLRYLLHDPPPPAPPNIPQLSRLDDEVLAVRDLQRAHMEEPQCAQCHQRIDPIGYGLENFDAAGRWREQEVVLKPNKQNRNYTRTEFEIDSTGTLPNGDPFNNFYELRDSIAKQEEAFARGFTESLIAYALGRPYGFTDLDLAEEILAAAEAEGNQIQTFISTLVQSQQFRRK